MPLKKDRASTSAAEGAFERIARQSVDFESLPQRTVTVSFRIPAAEKSRLKSFFSEQYGISLAEGVRRALYDWINGRTSPQETEGQHTITQGTFK